MEYCDTLIDVGVKFIEERKFLPNLLDNIPDSVYVQELRTLSIDCGRRSGKTTWINNNSRKGDVVLIYTKPLRGMYNTEAKVMTISEAKSRNFDFTKYNKIYVDMPKQCGRVINDYDWFRKCKFNRNSIVVKLGE